MSSLVVGSYQLIFFSQESWMARKAMNPLFGINIFKIGGFISHYL